MLEFLIKLICALFGIKYNPGGDTVVLKDAQTDEKPSDVVELDSSSKAKEMSLSVKGYLELADREGLALQPYLDSVGVKTVGIGSTQSDIPDLQHWSWNKELTVQEVINYYKNGLRKYEKAVNDAVKVPISQNQFDALVSITYNIGTGGMTKSTFIKLINFKSPIKNIVSAILMWDRPPEIMGRRRKEADLFSKGIYSNKDGCVDYITVNSATHHPSYRSRIKIDSYL